MNKLLNCRISKSSHPIACCYINQTSQVQIVRITNIPNFFFERVVLPGTQVLFDAVADACLEIHTGNPIAAILADKLLCKNLRVRKEKSHSNSNTSRQKKGKNRTVESTNLSIYV